MFFRQRPAATATLSYFFGCTGIGKSVAVDVVAGDEDWFIAEAAKVGVPISYVIDTHVHADHYSGGPELARRAGAPYAGHESNRGRLTFDFMPLADGQRLDAGNVVVDVLHTPGHTPDSISKRADRDASNGTVELYSHGNGRVGVMVEINCETDFVARNEQFRTLAHEIALQIAASAPRYITADEIPAAELEHESEIARARAKEEGKPDNVLPKIVEGRIEKFKDEVCLLRQPYIRDESITIEKLILPSERCRHR